MTSCCPPPRMRWSGAIGAIARCKRVSTGCGRKRRFVRAWRWICGVKPTPKAGNKPWQHCIVHGLAKPGRSATVSEFRVEKTCGNSFEKSLQSCDRAVKFVYTSLNFAVPEIHGYAHKSAAKDGATV